MPAKKKTRRRRGQGSIPQCCCRRIAERELNRIAEVLPSDVWKKFARSLGVGDTELNDIQARDFRDPEEQRYQMLRTWWLKTDEPTFRTLWEKAVALQRLQLANTICRIASSCGIDSPSSPTSDLEASFGGNENISGFGPSEDSPANVGLPYENGTVTPASLGLPDSDIHDGVYTHEDRVRRWTDPKITRPKALHGHPPQLSHSLSHTGITMTDLTPVTKKTSRSISDSATTSKKSRSMVSDDVVKDQGPQLSQPISSTDEAHWVCDVSDYRIRAVVNVAKKNGGMAAIFMCIVFVSLLTLSFQSVFADVLQHPEDSPCHGKLSFSPMLQIALIVLSTFIFPSVLTCVFWHVLKRGVGDQHLLFMEELMKEENKESIKEYVHTYVGDKNETQGGNYWDDVKHLRGNMEVELQYTCLTAIIQAAVTTCSCMLSFQATGLTSYMEMARIILLGLVQAFSSIMFGFYYRDMSLKHCICSLHAVCKGHPCLGQRAQEMEQCLTERWFKLEIFCCFASVLYPLLMLGSWSSGLPLSCKPPPLDLTQSHVWLMFVAITTICRAWGTTFYSIGPVRFVGPIFEALFLLYMFANQATWEWMQYLKILYCTVPISYLVWYNLATMHCQWDTLGEGDKPARMSRLCSRSGLLVLLMLALCASTVTEYGYLASGKSASTLGKCPTLPQGKIEDSWEQLQLLANQYCSPIPSSMSVCYENQDNLQMLYDLLHAQSKCVFIPSHLKESLLPTMNKVKEIIELSASLKNKETQTQLGTG